ncbi:MAG: hypothetical protein UV60_C0004G0039 [Parcubacteria group bacterium GW2011_GWA2_43_11]|nr:MAG: hypothetical protein UU89_C0017G0030 [Parcubacteria group bacterium GW2011_GWC2_42_11]KKS85962.1 MAG: hypothetical protein UV60_C0004G0039 [Parcubacteria group bacterium GW2011_GWA2_43_11]
MILHSADTRCNTDPVFQPATLIHTVPIPETPSQVCALYGFTCVHNMKRNFPLENNPILKTIIEYGRFPSDEFIRKFIPRPFLILETRYGREPTIEEMYYYWESEHQHVQEGETPVFLVEVTDLELEGKNVLHRGKVIGSRFPQNPSVVIFNHLGYPVEVGIKVFVHNFEIAELVPLDFPL